MSLYMKRSLVIVYLFEIFRCSSILKKDFILHPTYLIYSLMFCDLAY